jgi:excisionase family DNA binding protein
MGLSRLTTVSELSKTLGVSVKTVRKWITKESLPHMRISGSIWLYQEKVEKWMQERELILVRKRSAK